MDEDLERVFKEWVDVSTNDDDIKIYLHKNKASYHSFLVYFLQDIIKKK